ncbi:ATP-binding protein [Angustibacter speluncae]
MTADGRADDLAATPGPVRHRALPDLRPLDPVRSIKAKLALLVAATVTVAALLVWFGLNNQIRTLYTLPTAIVLSLVVTQLLARGMTSPLREMTAAARAMAKGDYSRRVHATSHDEVGELAVAFNRMADDLASVDRQRRDLVANVSHELRTPVTALRATLENLVDGVTEPDPATLTTALAQTERLGTLVAQLLDLSRLEAGVVPLDLVDVEVRSFLDEAVAAARLVDDAVDRDVLWEVQVEPPDLRVDADPARLHQVVANLLDNAARHSPPGGRVRVVAVDTGHEVVVEVQDEGPGIAPEDRERVFERFHRAGAAQSASGGTGLGLAIARWAVDLHGGSIVVADTGVGATIRIALPAHRPPRPGSAARLIRRARPGVDDGA